MPSFRALRRSTPGVLHHLAGDGVRHQAGDRVRQLAGGRAVGLHPDGVDDRVRPAAAGQLAHGRRHVVDGADVDRLHAVGLRARQALGHQVQPDDRAGAQVLGDPRRHLADRAQADDGHAAAVGDLGVLHGLPRRGQDVGEEQEAVVRRALGNLDRPVVGLRDAQQLRLAARHLAVELRVAEEAGAHALVAVLRRLALALEPVLAHEAVPARDVEGHDDAIADRQVVHPGAHGLDDAHRLVAEHVAGLEERAEDLVEVQVGAAQPGRGHADDRVGRLLDGRIGDGVDAHVALSMPGQGLHLMLRSVGGSRRRTRRASQQLGKPRARLS